MGDKAHIAGLSRNRCAEQDITLRRLLNLIGDGCRQVEVLAIGRQPYFYALGQKNVWTGFAEESPTHIMDGLHDFDIQMPEQEIHTPLFDQILHYIQTIESKD